MLRWCSFCQHFLSEVPPFDDFSFSHGLCTTCHGNIPNAQDMYVTAKRLKEIQVQLWEAGKKEDVAAALKIIEAAAGNKLRAVDIFLGLMGPLLYEVGELWKKGLFSVAEEHRFTSFCEAVFVSIARAVKAAPESKVLLANAPGNRHTLAIRILELWLVENGVCAKALYPAPASADELVERVKELSPDVLLLSVALAEHESGVRAVVEKVSRLPGARKLRIIVGGNAVKSGLLSQVPGTEQVADLSLLKV